MFNITHVIFIFLLSLFLTACGGGSTGSNNPDTTDTTIDTDLNTPVNSARPNIYLYETGKIIYDIRQDTTIANIQITLRGTKRFVFKDWGNIRVEQLDTETTTVTTNPTTGEVTTTVITKNELEKWDTPKRSIVDFEDEIIRIIDFGPALNSLTGNALLDAIAPVLPPALSNDGIKIVALRSCTVNIINEFFTQCVNEGGINTSGILLEAILNSPSGTRIETATSANFDIFIDESEFTLPAFSTFNAN